MTAPPIPEEITALSDADLLRLYRNCAEETYRRSQTVHPFYWDADRSELDCGYMGMWQALCAWEKEVHNRGDPIYPGVLRRKVYEIAGDRPALIPVFALATTRYGREQENGQ